uniref:Uncharacterized protein n=1 Tax=Junco hyemalis TaxID=40217 RepID=A0A8C5NIL8_JUNHY
MHLFTKEGFFSPLFSLGNSKENTCVRPPAVNRKDSTGRGGEASSRETEVFCNRSFHRSRGGVGRGKDGICAVASAGAKLLQSVLSQKRFRTGWMDRVLVQGFAYDLSKVYDGGLLQVLMYQPCFTQGCQTHNCFSLTYLFPKTHSPLSNCMASILASELPLHVRSGKEEVTLSPRNPCSPGLPEYLLHRSGALL